MKNKSLKITPYICTMGLSLLLNSQAFPAITYSGLSPIANSIVDDGTGTTYSGTWSESNTGASGGWSVTITYTGGSTLNWEGDAGSSAVVGSGNPNGGGLVLDFRAGSSNEVDSLLMVFSMTVDPGSSTADTTYAVGPVNGSFPDWGDAVINTGGTYVADTGGGQNANYNDTTGFIDPSPANGGNSAHNWYVTWASGTTITWEGDTLQRDTHIFGASDVSFIPEPGSSLMLSLAGIGFILNRKRK